jgi:hypothetical protein
MNINGTDNKFAKMKFENLEAKNALEGKKLTRNFRIKRIFEVEVEVALRLAVSQSVCLEVGRPFGAHDQILLFPFFCQKIALLFVLGRPL